VRPLYSPTVHVRMTQDVTVRLSADGLDLHALPVLFVLLVLFVLSGSAGLPYGVTRAEISLSTAPMNSFQPT